MSTSAPAPIRLTDVSTISGLVIELWQTRGRLKSVNAINDEAQKWLKIYHQLNVDTVAGRAVMTQRIAHRAPYLKFDTKRLKKVHPGAYERCRILVPQHAVSHVSVSPDAGDYGQVLPGAPRGAVSADVLDTAPTLAYVHAEKLRIRPALTELRKAETEIKAALEMACEPYLYNPVPERRWDGQPWAFSDGFTFGIRTRKFDVDTALKLLAPAVAAEFSAMSPASEYVTISVIDAHGHAVLENDASPWG